MSTTTRDLIEKRAKAHAATAAIANRPADPSTGMRSAADAAAIDRGLAEVAELTAAIAREGALATTDATMREVPAGNRAPETRGDGAASTLTPVAHGEARWGHPMAREQRLADLPSPYAFKPAPGDAGRFVRGLVTGNWRGASPELMEFRALSEGGSGGFLVPTPLANVILDKARNQSRVLQAGARTFPMDSDTLKAAKVLTDPVPAWRNEAGVIVESDVTFGQVTFNSQSLAVVIKASLEIIEDVAGMEGEIERILSAAFALELDRAALFGSGVTPEPLGVFNTAGVNKVALGVNGAALANYAPLTGTAARLAAKNYDPGAYLAAPRSAAALAGLVDSTGQPLVPPAYVSDHPILSTGQIPVNQVQGTSGAVASSIFQGQWDQLGIGIRTEFRILPLRERYMDTGQIGLVGWLRADVQVLRADAFEVVTGVL